MCSYHVLKDGTEQRCEGFLKNERRVMNNSNLVVLAGSLLCIKYENDVWKRTPRHLMQLTERMWYLLQLAAEKNGWMCPTVGLSDISYLREKPIWLRLREHHFHILLLSQFGQSSNLGGKGFHVLPCLTRIVFMVYKNSRGWWCVQLCHFYF